MNTITLYKNLRTNSKNAVKSYRSDWRHDRTELRKNSDVPFIHVARESGTCYFPIWRDYRIDSELRPHIFGQSTKLEMVRQHKSTFKTCMSDAVVWQHYDGKQLKVIDRDKAIAIASKL